LFKSIIEKIPKKVKQQKGLIPVHQNEASRLIGKADPLFRGSGSASADAEKNPEKLAANVSLALVSGGSY
jgi:hypothetical protein